MKGVAEFLNWVLDEKRKAEAFGLTMDVLVLHQEFYETLMEALSRSPHAAAAFSLVPCRKDKDRKDIYLHGIKTLWSSNRLPRKNAWIRYSNPNFKKAVAV